MEPKTTIRYFVGKKDKNNFSHKLIDSDIDLQQTDKKDEKIVKNWKNDNKVKTQFLNNRFVSKDKLKKYDRREKLNIVFIYVLISIVF